MDVIEVEGLRRSYGRRVALDGVDLAVTGGSAIAVLGPNGAGKSTFVEILEGHRGRDAGIVRVLGQDPERPTRRWRARMGIVLQETGMVTELTVRELLTMYAGYYPRPRPVDEVLELVGLDGAGDRRPDHLSGGQQRRLEVGLAIVGRPDLVFLDEPTTGFDPEARRQAWAFLVDLRTAGVTVVLTTHDLDEAATLAGRIVVLAGGRIVADASPQALRERAGPPVVRYRVPPGHGGPELCVPVSRHHDGTVSVAVEHPTDLLRSLCAWEEATGQRLADLTVARPSLEDAYLELIR